MNALFLAVAAAGALLLGDAGVKIRVGSGAGRMDERGPTVWQVNGNKIHVDQTYFQAEAKDLTFVVEWRCADCRAAKEMNEPQALAVSRAVLWHAIESGEANRTTFHRVGAGRTLTNRLRSTISYEVAGKPKTISLTVDKLDTLFDWTWTIGARPYHVSGPGYYFDLDARRLYFTVKWHDPALCEQLVGITDDRAADLAMPLLKHIVARKLFKYVPRVWRPSDDPDVSGQEVGAVGVELGCPDPACAGAVDCPAKGYRVSRTLPEISSAP
jgi:hypothetical protein